MLESWLSLPFWAMFLVLGVGFTLTGGLIFALSFNRWIRAHVLRCSGVVPPYVNVLAVLLALLTGFVASDTWERQKHARQVVQAESDAVLAVYDISIAAQTNMSKIREALRAYVGAVIDDEWPKMAQGGGESPKASDALSLLMIRVTAPKIGQETSTTQAALLNSTLKIRAERGERLSLNDHETDQTKWLVLLILGLLTQCAIGIVHLERPQAHAAALVIFTAGLVSTVGLVAEHEWPFDGPGAVQPTPLRRANARIWKGGVEFTGPRKPDEVEPTWTPPPGGLSPQSNAAPPAGPQPPANADPKQAGESK